MSRSSQVIDHPGHLRWVHPTYLGIQWPNEQLLATPNEEIDQDAFMRLMFCGGHSLCDINYESVYIPNPAMTDLWFKCPNQKDFGDSWNHGHNYVTVSTGEVERFLASGRGGQCKRCHVDLVCDQQRIARFPENWPTNYYFFPDYALASMHLYTSLKQWPHKTRTYEDFIGKGALIAKSKDYAYVMRYWRIGCQHKNMNVHWVAMHDRHDNCPDCGFHAQYDTSG